MGQGLFLLCGLILAVGDVQNNVRTRESAHVFRPRSSATKVQSNLYLFHKTSSRILRKCPGVHLTRLKGACLHGGGGPQIGEVTRFGGVTRLSI